MQVKEFVDRITNYADDIGCSGNGSFGAHTFPSSVRVYDEEMEESYDIDDIEIDYLMGCSCPSGITIIIKRRVC